MRDDLEARLGDTPSGIPDSGPDLAGLSRRAAARRSRRIIAATVAAALVLAGVAVPLAIVAPLGGHHPVKGGIGPTPRSGHLVVVSTTRMPHGITDVAVGEGWVWVSGSNELDRVDPHTGRVAKRIRLPATGEDASIAFGFGSVWVTGGIDSRSAGLFRINPTTGQVTSIRTPLASGVATGGGFVWVTHPTQDRGQLIRVDPATNHVAGAPIVVGVGPGGVIAAAGFLWVTESSNPAGVTKVDPTTGKVVRTLHRVSIVEAFGAGSLWGLGTGPDDVSRIDPLTGQVVATIAVPRVGTVAYGDGTLWGLTSPRSSSQYVYEPIPGSKGDVFRIDPATNRLIGKAIPFGITPAAIAADRSGAWVGDSTAEKLTHVVIAPVPGSESGSPSAP